MRRVFVGKTGYQVPKGAIVEVIRFFPRRKALIEYEGRKVLTMSYLLWKIRVGGQKNGQKD